MSDTTIEIITVCYGASVVLLVLAVLAAAAARRHNRASRFDASTRTNGTMTVMGVASLFFAAIAAALEHIDMYGVPSFVAVYWTVVALIAAAVLYFLLFIDL